MTTDTVVRVLAEKIETLEANASEEARVLRAKLDDATRERHDLINRLERAQGRWAGTARERDDMGADLAAITADRDAIANDRESVVRRLAVKAEELDECVSKHAVMADEYAKYRDTWLKKCERLEAERDNVRLVLDEMAKERDTLKSALDSLTADSLTVVGEVAKERDGLRTEVTHLRKRLDCGHFGRCTTDGGCYKHVDTWRIEAVTAAGVLDEKLTTAKNECESLKKQLAKAIAYQSKVAKGGA